jgi:hypothetical protein
VAATCSQQGRSVFHFLQQAVHAHFTRQPAPSLLVKAQSFMSRSARERLTPYRHTRNVFAKAESVGYTSGRPIGLKFQAVDLAPSGGAPLWQSHDTLRPAGGACPTPPPHSWASYTAPQTGFGVLGGSA